jgi:hypothetical protein
MSLAWAALPGSSCVQRGIFHAFIVHRWLGSGRKPRPAGWLAARAKPGMILQLALSQKFDKSC